MRPFIVAAVLRNISFDAESYASFIDLQVVLNLSLHYMGPFIYVFFRINCIRIFAENVLLLQSVHMIWTPYQVMHFTCMYSEHQSFLHLGKGGRREEPRLITRITMGQQVMHRDSSLRPLI